MMALIAIYYNNNEKEKPKRFPCKRQLVVEMLDGEVAWKRSRSMKDCFHLGQQHTVQDGPEMD